MATFVIRDAEYNESTVEADRYYLEDGHFQFQIDEGPNPGLVASIPAAGASVTRTAV